MLHPIKSTTQIWAVTRHQYGISAPVLQTSIRGENYCIYFFCESLQETIMNITEVSEAAITVRGTFFPPGMNKSDVFLS